MFYLLNKCSCAAGSGFSWLGCGCWFAFLFRFFCFLFVLITSNYYLPSSLYVASLPGKNFPSFHALVTDRHRVRTGGACGKKNKKNNFPKLRKLGPSNSTLSFRHYAECKIQKSKLKLRAVTRKFFFSAGHCSTK